MRPPLPIRIFPALLVLSFAAARLPAAAPDYAAVHGLFAQHCLDCHAAQDPEGKLVLDDFPSLLRGGEYAVLVPLVALMLLLGVAPHLLSDLINPLVTSWAGHLTGLP